MLRNVLVFSLGQARWALELRWVREVERMGNITPVPGAPEAIAGLINLRGQIVPVIASSVLPGSGSADGGAKRSGAQLRQVRKGDQAILVDLDGVPVALPADRIVEVTSLENAPGSDSELIGADDSRIQLIDPPAILQQLRQAVDAAAASLAASVWGPV